MFKNVAGKFVVFAWDTTTGVAKSGDAANLTAYVSKDYGTVTVLADTSATEMDSTNAKGFYLFDAAQGETNGDFLLITAKSSTSNIAVIGAPAGIFTRPTTGWLAPTTAGRTLDVSTGGEAGLDWANVGSPTTTVALTGTTIATTQKVDVDTIKTNPVVNGGTVTFPTNATLASTTNITAGTITTVTTVTNQLTAAAIATGVWQDTTAGDFTVALSIGKSIMNGVSLGTGLTVARCTLTDTLTTYTGNTVQTGDSFARIGANGASLTSLAPASTALSTVQWTNTLATNLGTLAGHDPGTTLGTSTLTQTQVSGGAYALNSSSFSFNAALDFTTTQKAATLARVTLVDDVTTKTGYSLANGSFITATFGTCDFTATMKTSIGTAVAASAVASVTGNVGGNVVGTVTSVVGAVGSVTGNVGGNVVGSVGSLATQAKADVNAEADAALADAGVTTTVTGRIDVAVSTRLASASYTTPPTVTAIRQEIDSNSVGLAAIYTDTHTTIPTTLVTIAGYIDTEVGAIKAKTDNLPGDPADASDIAAAFSSLQTHGDSTWATATSVTVSDKTGFKLASDGLDSLPVTGPTGVAATIREMIVQLWRRYFKRVTRNSTQIKTYADNGTTVITTQAYTASSTDDDVGAAT